MHNLQKKSHKNNSTIMLIYINKFHVTCNSIIKKSSVYLHDYVQGYIKSCTDVNESNIHSALWQSTILSI